MSFKLTPGGKFDMELTEEELYSLYRVLSKIERHLYYTEIYPFYARLKEEFQYIHRSSY